MDIYSTNLHLCAIESVIGTQKHIFANIKVTPRKLMFIENFNQKLGLDDTYDIECWYEAGGRGYSLYNQLTVVGV